MKASFARRVYERLLDYAPAKLAAAIDYFLVPGLRRSWGGAFNGQQRRAEMVREILAACRFDAIVETGTYRGTTSSFFLESSPLPLFTVERERRFFEFARLRFRHEPRVRLLRADTRDALWSLVNELCGKHVFFYLDAHWREELPIREELSIVARGWREFVVLIDDFAVPDDPGYGFDDWGAGARLTLADSGAGAIPDVSVFWPAALSALETGERRGSVILARGSAVESLAALHTVRR
jgi:hypothetical protein